MLRVLTSRVPTQPLQETWRNILLHTSNALFDHEAPKKRESLGKFPSHKRYCSYGAEKRNVLGWQRNDEAHNEHRALLFYICNVLCLS